MDFIFCCPDSCHVSVDTVHPSLLRSVSSSSAGGTISSVCLTTYSQSRISTCPNHLSLTFLHLSVMFSTFSLSLHLCHFQFLHVELVIGTISILCRIWVDTCNKCDYSADFRYRMLVVLYVQEQNRQTFFKGGLRLE